MRTFTCRSTFLYGEGLSGLLVRINNSCAQNKILFTKIIASKNKTRSIKRERSVRLDWLRRTIRDRLLDNLRTAPANRKRALKKEFGLHKSCRYLKICYQIDCSLRCLELRQLTLNNPSFSSLIKKNFLIYKEIQKGAVAKSYMTNSLLIYD
jgi:hypothetical protein